MLYNHQYTPLYLDSKAMNHLFQKVVSSDKTFQVFVRNSWNQPDTYGIQITTRQRFKASHVQHKSSQTYHGKFPSFLQVYEENFFWTLRLNILAIYSLNSTNSGWSVSPRTLWSSTESEISLRITFDLSSRILGLVSKSTFKWTQCNLWICAILLLSIIKKSKFSILQVFACVKIMFGP